MNLVNYQEMVLYRYAMYPIPGALIMSVRITPLDMQVIQTLCDDIL